MRKTVCAVCRVLVVLGLILFLSACSTMEVASIRPNIILISADDMGCMDVQEYAHHITGEKKRKMYYETPNLDRLCLEGLSFEQACASQLYSPEHAGMLTGRINAAPAVGKGGSTAVKREQISIAGVLPDYHTAFIGKWHAGATPAAMGFDQPGLTDASGNCSADDLTERATRYIESRSRTRGRPFFLYLSHFSVDDPQSVKERDIQHFTKKRTRGWNGHDDPRHAAMVKGVDDSVGRILHKLWRIGLDDNTVVIFMPVNSRAAASKKGSMVSTGTPVPLMIRWEKYVKAGSWSKVPVDYADILPTVMQCAGYFPETLGEDAGIDGCSLSGLFRDARNKSKSYEREVRCSQITACEINALLL